MPIIQELLIDDYSIEQAEALQLKYQNKLYQKIDNVNFIKLNGIKKIVGIDISYFKKDNIDYGVACAVLWDLNKKLMESYYLYKNRIKFQYKPGFLGFRECKLLAKVVSKIHNKIDLIMCDGHGKIHPRRFGEAVQIGFALNIPSIGVAKNPFFGYYNWHNKKYIKGNKSPIWAKNPELLSETTSNELLGYAICLKNDSKPVFISTGYKITLETALKVCLESTTEHRQPEPLYLADKLSRIEVEKYI
ncbi:MAG: endonuclease V [Candidatus Thorarchaeota archaeon]